MNKEKENKKGVKNSRLSKKTVAVVASVVMAIVAVLGLAWDICWEIYSTQASKPTQVYVQGNQNTVVLCEQSCTAINLP
uniref:hypothetical protein n=1 Tax=Corynebacterium glutamicum TaxID=1718 RepID=UPI0009645656|nr:hypothetical protein [Corynebacterium glutamicum]